MLDLISCGLVGGAIGLKIPPPGGLTPGIVGGKAVGLIDPDPCILVGGAIGLKVPAPDVVTPCDEPVPVGCGGPCWAWMRTERLILHFSQILVNLHLSQILVN